MRRQEDGDGEKREGMRGGDLQAAAVQRRMTEGLLYGVRWMVQRRSFRQFGGAKGVDGRCSSIPDWSLASDLKSRGPSAASSQMQPATMAIGVWGEVERPELESREGLKGDAMEGSRQHRRNEERRAHRAGRTV
jgi:hypothetical protein